MSQIGTEGLKLPAFTERHVGPSPEDLENMLKELGFETLESLTDSAVPERIRLRDALICTGRKANLKSCKLCKGLPAKTRWRNRISGWVTIRP